MAKRSTALPLRQHARMAVFRVDTLTADPQPVFDWVKANVPEAEVVRTVAFKTVKGYYFKCVFRRQADAEAFHRRWNPGAADFTVGPFGVGPTPVPTVPRAVEPAAPGRRRASAFLRWLGLGVSVALVSVLPSALRG